MSKSELAEIKARMKAWVHWKTLETDRLDFKRVVPEEAQEDMKDFINSVSMLVAEVERLQKLVKEPIE